MSELDIIVPVYNEAENIKEFFSRLNKSLTEAKIDYKVIFVDDNSTDETSHLIQSLPGSRIEFLKKKGKRGKAYSILEGFEASKAPFIAMIDGDLEYPPEAIPEMFEKMSSNGAVVARRENSHGGFLRRLGSRLNRAIFGRVLLGFNCDVQSGLKMFRREIFEYFDKKNVSAWAIDMPLLYTTLELGYSIGEVKIKFAPRVRGASQLKAEFVNAMFQIATTAIRLRRSSQKIYRISGESADSSLGTGVVHKRKRYITHTKLPSHLSSLVTFSPWQKYAIFSVLIVLLIGFILWGKTTAILLVGALTCIYFLDVLFNLFLVLKSLHFPPEIGFTDDQLSQIKDSSLPLYSILCPLYKEAHILPKFVESMDALDWPKNKLEVLLLLEEDDKPTIEAAKAMNLPSHFKILVVPHSFPKTKPKACNYGLIHSSGEYVVIYDAEDRPDSLQLKKAYLAFQGSPEKVVCLQAKLNYYNPHQNLLTRLFTAEYSLWFDMVLPGLQSINTAIPLGGTSNHFKTSVLKDLHGWDAFNVTEDCDLGARLFKAGYVTSIIDSTTLEEANSRVGNWFRQRSRWIKGYIQTYLVHNRNPFEFIRTHGIHAFVFQLVVGGKIAFMVINPFLWIATILYFTLYSIFGPTIESLYPAPIFYMAVISLVFGNFLFLYYYMIGAAKRGHWALIKYIYLIPIYWLAVSLAAFKAFAQLIIKPHYWEKTTHGLDVKKVQPIASTATSPSKSFNQQIVLSGGILVFATLLANFLNFLGSTFLTRSTSISFAELGVLGFIGSITAISDVIFGAISKTITYKTAFLLGKHNRVVKNIWKLAFNLSLVLGLSVSALWFVSVPFLSKFFASPVLPLLITAPVWFFTVITAINSGFLSGAHKFAALAGFLVIEAITKLVATFGLVYFGHADLVYLALPISLAVSAIFGIIFILLLPKHAEDASLEDAKKVPSDFFFSSIALKAAGVLFLSMDVIIAKHFLDPVSAGQYVLLSTIGKMVYFFGSLFTGFISPLVSRNEGAEKSSTNVFDTSLILTAVTNIAPIIFVGILGPIVIPLLFSTKSLAVTSYLLPYTIAMSFFSISGVITNYHLAKRHHLFSVASLSFAIGQSVALIISAHTINDFVSVITIASAMNLVALLILHLFYDSLVAASGNFLDFFLVFKRTSLNQAQKGKRILILNWRDTKHLWAGGAEVYIHELAKRWVKDGNQVTVFCGNDRRSVRNEVVDGVQIVRRGGFYTVYLWAFIYYILKFRGQFDLIIDSENGVPFFAKLYAGVPTYLLVYHVNQGLFQQHLSLPLSILARFTESKMLPIVYGRSKVITISESTKTDIIKHKLAQEENISIIYPGFDVKLFAPAKKTEHPSFIYLGRLKPYKNIDVALKAFASVYKKHKNARLTIAGDGESKGDLQRLTKDLGLESVVKFVGKVTESVKASLLASHWIALQPSSVEGWGITVIEANASGTPVVASNVPGLRESVSNPHTGYLVTCGDEKAFAEKILMLTENNSLREEMGKNAVVWAEKYGWEASAKAFREAIGI